MNIIEILLIGIGLAMDAFAVAVCKGLSIKKLNLNKMLTVGLYFGFFQGLMPIIGYFLGTSFGNVITKLDHWISFILLILIGGNMINESFEKTSETSNDKVNFKTMIPLAIATSIDALAIGITFAFLRVNIVFSTLIIGITTFVLSVIGIKLGNRFGNKYEKKAQFIGGLILIIIGLKILLEHLSVI